MFTKTVRQIHDQLLRQKKTLAVAESCTGGQLCDRLTQMPGASAYFLLGAITYSNQAKKLLLNIPLNTILRYGAVSAPVAKLMACNIRKKISADFGLGITGIAGPKGGHADKPAGTVYIGLSTRTKDICRKFKFNGSRQNIRKQATQNALRLLCAHLSR